MDKSFVNKLITRIQKGDIQAFEELVKLYEKKIYTLCCHLTGDHTDALDLAQDVLINVYNALPKFRQEASFDTWLYRIASNVWMSELRRKSRHKRVFSLDKPVETDKGEEIGQYYAEAGPGPEEHAMLQEEAREIRKALMELSEEQRTVLVLRDMHGYSYDEMAQILNCTLGTVKSRLNRARKALKKRLSTIMKGTEQQGKKTHQNPYEGRLSSNEMF
ncbi:RNA polymerase sigma factor [Desulfolucanica intricata]|uniref:RNA polymerase sigma factor n=1 Tax=Desulfolucanica intricata TaxID=1285191 RepID=UPI00082FAF0F|nr:sigma-70 family RNA polymerase sigma factor [Desulfolucanica intricata]